LREEKRIRVGRREGEKEISDVSNHDISLQSKINLNQTKCFL